MLRPGGRFVLGFQERTPEVEAALPSDIYHLRSCDEVLALLTEAGLDPSASRGRGPGVWVVEARRR